MTGAAKLSFLKPCSGRLAGVSTNVRRGLMASNVDSVKVEISVVLGRSVIPMHQLLRMGRGAVIELDSHQDDPVTILANDKPVARGEIQIQGDKIAVSVVDLLKSY
ncbi:MAG TPA: FliM/FliN family flagellar motor switch protein [Rhizomicrobium sp.]|jgi:flagellar motor switch protein FliN/FliY|nr:FliM/FliN family flagellar motor switch protein [Rhizomicrobium sp.]